MNIKTLYDKINKPVIIYTLKITITGFVVFLVDKNLSRHAFSGILGNITAGYILMVLILGIACFLIQVRRWRIVLLCFGYHVKKTTALQTMLWGCLLAFITPGRAGEFLRGISLQKGKKIDTVFAVAIDKILAGFGILTLGLYGLAYSALSGQNFFWAHWIILAASIVFFSLIPIAYLLKGRKIITWLRCRLSGFSKTKIIEICFLSLLSQLVCCIQTAILFSMFGSNLFIENTAAAGLAYALMMLFPFSIANIGIREYSFGIFLSGIPLSGATQISQIAFASSLGILAVNIVLPALVGLAWWLLTKGNKLPTHQSKLP
jgi:hypothetical protein